MVSLAWRNKNLCHAEGGKDTTYLQEKQWPSLLGHCWAVSPLCLVPTGRWLTSVDTVVLLLVSCTSDFLAFGNFYNCTYPPQYFSSFKVSIGKLKGLEEATWKYCLSATDTGRCQGRLAAQLLKPLQFTAKKRREEGIMRELHSRALQIESGTGLFLLWRLVVKK